MNKTTAKFKLRKELKNKAALCPIALQAFINGEKCVIASGFSVKENQWDDVNGRVINHPDLSDLNIALQNEMSKATRIFVEYRLANRVLTKKQFYEDFTEYSKRNDFVAFYESQLEKRLLDNKISKGTYKAQKVTLGKLKQFKEKITFNELNTDLVEAFDLWHTRHLKNEIAKSGKKQVNNSHNTKAKALSHIRTYMNLAIKKKGVKVENPFSEIKIRETEGSIVFLEVSELAQLHDLFQRLEHDERNYKITVGLFLLSCFTGLRISDVKNIRMLPITNNYELTFQPKKTLRYNKTITIPMNNAAKYFYNWLLGIGDIDLHDNTINTYLKTISRKAGIKKHLSMHVARHTFATQFIANGGNVVYLQQILGHGDMRTTMRYVHIVDSTKREQIFKLDAILQSF